MSTWLNRGASGGLAGARRSSRDQFSKPPRSQKFGHSQRQRQQGAVPAGQGEPAALPTAAAFDHMSTAFEL